MFTSNKTFWPLVAAVGVSFVGYCVYFDRKRRSAPDFQEKLKAKRRKQKPQTASMSNNIRASSVDDMRRFFLEQVQLGEACLSSGDFDNGINYLGKAVLVSGEPESVMQCFQQSLPAELFEALLARLPILAQSMYNPAMLSTTLGSTAVPELDLE